MKNQQLNQREPVPANMDLGTTSAIPTFSGHAVWQKGHVLRQTSDQQGVVPVEVFFDPVTGQILTATLPPALREEYESSGNGQSIGSNQQTPNTDENWGDIEWNDNEDWSDNNSVNNENLPQETANETVHEDEFDEWWENEGN